MKKRKTMIRVQVKPIGEGETLEGEFLGLLQENDGNLVSAVVRLDGYGLFLKTVHPSRVVPILTP